MPPDAPMVRPFLPFARRFSGLMLPSRRRRRPRSDAPSASPSFREGCLSSTPEQKAHSKRFYHALLPRPRSSFEC